MSFFSPHTFVLWGNLEIASDLIEPVKWYTEVNMVI